MLGSGSGSTLGIGLAIHLRDRFTAKAAAVNASMALMHKNATAAMTANLGAMRNAGMGMALIGGLGLRAMSGWVKQGAEFEYTMGAVAAVTKATKKELQGMTEQALQLGGETKFTIQEVADAMKFLGMAGFDPATINETVIAVAALGAATDLAISGIGGMSDVMTNIMTAFQLAPDQAMRVADVLVAISTSANTSVAQMGEAYKYAADVFTTLNIPLEESAAMLAMLGNAGLQASIAGTSLGNTWRKLGKAMTSFATKRQLKGMAFFGWTKADFINNKGQLKDMVEIINFMSKGFKAAGKTVEAAGAIEAITAIRGKRGLMPLIRDIKTGKTFAEYVNIAYMKSANEALRIAGERLNNLKGDSMILHSAWSAFTYAFQQALDPILRRVTQALTWIVKVLTWFSRTGIGKFVTVFVAGFTAIVFVAGIFIAVLGSIGLLLSGTTVSLRGMAVAGTWAYNAMSAAAWGFVAAGSAANAVIVGSYMAGGTKMLIHGSQAVAGGAAAGATLGFLGTIKMWFKTAIGWIVRGFRFLGTHIFKFVRILGWVGIILTVLEVVGVSLKQVFKGLVSMVIWIIQSTLNAVKGILDWIPFVNFEGSWESRQSAINQDYLGWMRTEGFGDQEDKERRANAGDQAWKDTGKENYKSVIGMTYGGVGGTPSPTIVNIHIDGKEAMQYEIKQGGENDLFTQLGINP